MQSTASLADASGYDLYHPTPILNLDKALFASDLRFQDLKYLDRFQTLKTEAIPKQL